MYDKAITNKHTASKRIGRTMYSILYMMKEYSINSPATHG